MFLCLLLIVLYFHTLCILCPCHCLFSIQPIFFHLQLLSFQPCCQRILSILSLSKYCSYSVPCRYCNLWCGHWMHPSDSRNLEMPWLQSLPFLLSHWLQRSDTGKWYLCIKRTHYGKRFWLLCSSDHTRCSVCWPSTYRHPPANAFPGVYWWLWILILTRELQFYASLRLLYDIIHLPRWEPVCWWLADIVPPLFHWFLWESRQYSFSPPLISVPPMNTWSTVCELCDVLFFLLLDNINQCNHLPDFQWYQTVLVQNQGSLCSEWGYRKYLRRILAQLESLRDQRSHTQDTRRSFR